jgi:hypothetical protein
MAVTWTTAHIDGWSYFSNLRYGSYRTKDGVLQEQLYQGLCWVERQLDDESLPETVRSKARNATRAVGVPPPVRALVARAPASA